MITTQMIITVPSSVRTNPWREAARTKAGKAMTEADDELLMAPPKERSASISNKIIIPAEIRSLPVNRISLFQQLLIIIIHF
jgi:hypothetical protein